MDYTLNAPLFLCYLRDYLARQAPAQLQALFRGEDCWADRQRTGQLLNGLQVLRLLEARCQALLTALPAGNPTYLRADQATVISYCLTLMDGDWAAALPFGLTDDAFTYCGAPVLVPRQRVRAANNRLLAANDHYLSAGTELVYADALS